MRIAVLTYQNHPKFITWEVPDEELLLADDRLVLEEFARRGVEAESVSWRNPAIDWNSFDVALIRSTWDYIDYPDEFLTAMETIHASSCRLLNPIEAVRWNVDKTYLCDLAAWGVAVVPTVRASEGLEQGWRGAVLKGRVGGGASDVHRLLEGEIEPRLAQLKAEGTLDRYLLQPFVESIMTEGEYSFFFIGGELSHTLHKKAAAGEYRAHSLYGGTNEIVQPPQEDIEQAQAILQAIPFDLCYARLDLVRIDGRLAVMEAELIEPVLYYGMAPEKVGLLVSAVISKPT